MGLADGKQDVFLYSATRLDDIMKEMYSMRPRAVVVDSIQTVYLDDVSSSAGSVSQVSLLVSATARLSFCGYSRHQERRSRSSGSLICC